jgi:hypothetical protein
MINEDAKSDSPITLVNDDHASRDARYRYMNGSLFNIVSSMRLPFSWFKIAINGTLRAQVAVLP